jgi:hypothetical protein
MTTKEKMLQARQLIQEKKYQEAQKILKTVDHPTAKEWLVKLDKLVKPEIEVPKKSLGANRNLFIGIGALAIILVIGVLAVVAFLPKPDTVSDLPIDTNNPLDNLIIQACDRAMEQALPSDRTDENRQNCLNTMRAAYSEIANRIKVYKPDAHNEDISFAMTSCLEFAGLMLWQWTDQMLVMCSDLYLTYQAGAFELIRTADKGCFTQEITLGSSQEDEAHDRCIRRDISTVTEIDYYHEDDSYTTGEEEATPQENCEENQERPMGAVARNNSTDFNCVGGESSQSDN